MPRITRVYTRTGDDGTTGLGAGGRVPKDSPRIEAYGTVDELNSQIGVALAAGLTEEVSAALQTIQNELFHLGSDLCILEEEKERVPAPRIEERHVVALENLMDRLSETLPPLANNSSRRDVPVVLHELRRFCRVQKSALITSTRSRAGFTRLGQA